MDPAWTAKFVRIDDDGPEREAQLRTRVAKLEKRVAVLTAVLRLLLTLLKLSRFRLELERVPDAADKGALIQAIQRARNALPLVAVLRVLRLSSSRYHAWVEGETSCTLGERGVCVRFRPNRLTGREILSIKDMVLSTAHRHMSVRALALHAQRIGQVFAHPNTWGRLIRERGWRRPRLRVYPAKPKMGVRAAGPNEKWHIDLTVLRVLDGTKLYLHAVIDNFSRKILAWKVADRVLPTGSCDVLLAAAQHLHRGETPDVICDSGSENVNADVTDLLTAHNFARVLAQVQVSYSNSIIEAWWRALKHQWLYLNELDSAAAVRRLVTFYVHQHNTVMPHASFDGQTPDEMFYGTGAQVPTELELAREQARAARLAANRTASCGECPRAQACEEEGVAA